MDCCTQYLLILLLSFIFWLLVTKIHHWTRPRAIYICPIEGSLDTYRALLPTDFYTKPACPGNHDGGYLYPRDADSVLEQLRTVVSTLHRQGALDSLDPYNLISIHERLAFTNSNDVVNWFTVQFNLFMGSVSALGTEKHIKMIEGARELKKLGCFALTEKGAGVLSGLFCDTIAYYNQETDKIVIHTPDDGAKKCWISYAGNDQTEYSVVFAKWVKRENTESDKHKSISTSFGNFRLTPHVVAILVKIRDNGIMVPGLTIEQCFTRSDFCSNSFGTLTFTEFNVPPENLLDRYCSLDRETCDLRITDNCPKLFFKLSNRLLVGRLCLSATSIVCAKLTLQHVIKKVYNSKRSQFSYVTDNIQTMIQQICEMDYYMRRLSNHFQIKSSSIMNDDIDQLLEQHLDEILLIKAYVPPLCRSIVGKCRELLGSDALLAHNRITESHAAAYASCLAEGDSIVMAQAFVAQCMRKYKHLTLRNWRLLWLMIKMQILVPANKRVAYVKCHQTEVIAAFQQIADGIFKNQGIKSSLASIRNPIHELDV